MTTLLYFAWVRERIGMAEESVDFPATLVTVDDLLDWLSVRSPGHAAALTDRGAVRVGVDQEFARGDAPIAGAREIAIFPPVTGGDHPSTLPPGEGPRDARSAARGWAVAGFGALLPSPGPLPAGEGER